MPLVPSPIKPLGRPAKRSRPTVPCSSSILEYTDLEYTDLEYTGLEYTGLEYVILEYADRPAGKHTSSGPDGLQLPITLIHFRDQPDDKQKNHCVDG